VGNVTAAPSVSLPDKYKRHIAVPYTRSTGGRECCWPHVLILFLEPKTDRQMVSHIRVLPDIAR